MDETNLYIAFPIFQKKERETYGLFTSFEEFINHLLPKPNRCYTRGFSVEFKLDLKILTAGFEPNDFILKFLVTELEKLGVPIDYVSNSTYEHLSKILRYTKKPTEFPSKHKKEMYTLSIDDTGLIIKSAHRQGVFYGIQTLLQIVLQMSKKKNEQFLTLPGLEIFDYPLFSTRGIAEDTSRGQCPTVESAKRYIDILARYKMNSYAIGYEGDNFYNERHPKIGEKVSQFTPEEIMEIDAYAKERFVNLIPIYVSLGHQDNILHIPEYQHLAEFPSAQCFNIADERIYSLIEDYFKTICNSFSSTNSFHIGCDESYDVGVYKSKEFVEKNGRSRVLLAHYKKMYDLAKKYGKEHIIMYHDIIANYDDIMKELPRDLNVMFWDYFPRDKYKLLKRIFHASKLPLILSPSHLSWCRHFPDYGASAKNIIGMVEYGKKLNKTKELDNPGVVGLLNSTWGDFNNPNFRENFVYGSALSAATGWGEDKADAKSILSSFLLHFFQIQDLKLANTIAEIVWKCADLNNDYRSGPKSMPQLFYMQLFRHPFAEFDKHHQYVKRYKKMGEKAAKILRHLNNVIPSITCNTKYLEYIRFSLKLVIILSQKEDLSTKSCKLVRDRYPGDPQAQNSIEELIDEIQAFQTELEKIIPEYEQLWLYCAKRPVLDFNLMRFKKLSKFCTEKIKELQDNTFYNNPFTPAEWISSNVAKTPPEGDFYREIIHFDILPEKVKLLGIAGSYVRIYVNGSYIGKVLSRMSLSILPIQNRVQVFDITQFLHVGSNVIAVEAYNFENIEPSFLCRIQYRINDEIITLTSDRHWKIFHGYNPQNPDLNIVKPSIMVIPVPDKWNSSVSSEFDASWENVKSLGAPPNYNGHIYDEDFLDGNIPVTEEYFGSKAWLYWAASTYLGKNFAKIAMKIFEHLKKVLKIA